jgi:RNA polymerase sigma-70 factor, ECF subfamily
MENSKPVTDSDESDRAFVQALIEDDPDAWRTFEARYKQVIQRSISAVTCRFSAMVGAEDVRELYAIVCLRLLERDKHKLRSFDRRLGHSLRGWLRLIATRTTYEYLRARHRQLRKERDGGTEIFSSSPADPHEQCWSRQQSEIARSLLDGFSARDRQFLSLYLAECDPTQIAQDMGISVGTVYTKRHKIGLHLSELAAELDLAA